MPLEPIQPSRKVAATGKRGAPTSTNNHLITALIKTVSRGGAATIDITPELAQALLERNEDNRSISQRRVAMFAHDMATGAWRLNNNAIGIGPEGQVWDGQHRLLAVVMAGVTIRMLVFGLELSARPTIDQGRPRSVGDNLRILDGEEHGGRIMHWLNAIETIEARRGPSLSYAVTRTRLATFDAGVRYFLEHPPARPFYRAAILGAFVFAFRTYSAQTKLFARGYTTGAELAANSPVLALRDYVADHSRIRSDSSRVISLKTLRCLEAHIADETIDKLCPSEEAVRFFQTRS